VPAHVRSYHGQCGTGVRIQPADPSQHQFVYGHERKSCWFTSAQNGDLLPRHEDFCSQRRPRSKQIDNETEYQSDEAQHPAQRRPILCTMPTGFYLRQGQVGTINSMVISNAAKSGLRARPFVQVHARRSKELGSGATLEQDQRFLEAGKKVEEGKIVALWAK
jgi:hypothetical protein